MSNIGDTVAGDVLVAADGSTAAITIHTAFVTHTIGPARPLQPVRLCQRRHVRDDVCNTDRRAG